MSEDPERLLAEALRAQARYAPPPNPTAPYSPTPPDDPAPVPELPGGYGLLSGTGSDELELRRAALDADPATPAPGPTGARSDSRPNRRTSHRRAPEPLPARWVLLLAVSLGMAVGSVVGLLTLL